MNDDARPATVTIPASLPARLVAEFAAQVRFFSRLPLPRLGPADDPAAPPPFARALRLLPFAGVAIAAPAALVVALAGLTELSSLAIAALAVVVTTIVTGAFHEDGLADVADGFGGGFSVERRLEIMKDSRIGAFGGIALAAQFVLRTVLIGDLIDGIGAGETALVLLGVAALARSASLVLMVALPPARADGLGRAAGRPEPGALAAALVVGGAFFVAVTVVPVGAFGVATGLVAAAAAAAGLAGLAKAKIGGFTGDVVGAGTLVVEIALLVGLTAA